MKYAVIYEKTVSGYSAYVSDLPGLGVAGANKSEVERLVREAIELHLEGLREDHLPIPQPTTETDYVTV